MQPKTRALLALAAVALVLDQSTKLWIVRTLERDRDIIEVIPGLLEVVHVQNPGAAFSLLAGYEHRMWVFLIFTLVALGATASIFRDLEGGDRAAAAALGLIASGALGNGLDRLAREAVIDFAHVYTEHPALAPWLRETFGAASLPIFNVADVTIWLGVLLLLFQHFRSAVAEEATPPPALRPALEPVRAST